MSKDPGYSNSKVDAQGSILRAQEKREQKILDYCEPHLDQMWAASIVGMILGCDFRDAKTELLKRKNK